MRRLLNRGKHPKHGLGCLWAVLVAVVLLGLLGWAILTADPTPQDQVTEHK